ncbi:DUF3397 domain-containing protein [Bhargavaea beijingensis]|uniref:DUF3397 domain-containing protein n=1 Tax=Bhargavaea beijingensis TaxID=426756 RepID=UPI0022246C1E|nr:DUF3397 domain-containing protein [Bhargavaea beijingensis]MCW1926847.1 DUF3397 domain-containing protein [Bhargavaea beijingensis]
MADYFFAAAGFLIAFPAVPFFFFFTVFTRLYKDPSKGFSRAADCTTFLLLPAVPAVVEAFTGYQTGFYLAMAVIVFALYMTYRERKTEHDFEIGPLLRKIWRLLFLILSAAYLAASVIGTGVMIADYIGR